MKSSAKYAFRAIFTFLLLLQLTGLLYAIVNARAEYILLFVIFYLLLTGWFNSKDLDV